MNRKLDGGTALVFLLLSNYGARGLADHTELVSTCFQVDVCWVAGRLLTGAQPCHAEQAGSLRLLAQLWAAMAAVTAKPSSCTHAARGGTGITIRQSGEPAEPDPQLRKRLKDCNKVMVASLLFMSVTRPVKQWKCLLMLKVFISRHKRNRSPQNTHFQQCCPATGCCSLCSLNQAVTGSHRYGYALWLPQLALIPAGILKVRSLCETC